MAGGGLYNRTCGQFSDAGITHFNYTALTAERRIGVARCQLEYALVLI
jgi:hypothetical protein